MLRGSGGCLLYFLDEIFPSIILTGIVCQVVPFLVCVICVYRASLHFVYFISFKFLLCYGKINLQCQNKVLRV